MADELDAFLDAAPDAFSDEALDAFLDAPADDPTPDVSRGESAVRGAAQGASLGFSDELVGAGSVLNDLIYGRSAREGVDLSRSGELYTSERDTEREENAAAQAANPGTYLTGELAGGIATPVPLGKIKAATTLGKIGQGARSGAVAGGIAGAGLSEADSVSGVAKDALGGAAGGAALGGGLGSLFAAGSRVARGVFPPTAAGARAAQAIEAEGGLLTPALQSESRAAKILESIAESSFLGSERISATRTQAIEAAQKPVQKLVEGLSRGASREQVGEIVQDALRGKIDAFKATTEALYRNVDDALAAGGATEGAVSLLPVKQLARQLLKEAGEGLKDTSAEGVLRQVAEKADVVPFRAAARLRSDLLSVTRSSQELIGGRAQAGARRLAASVDGAIADAVQSVGPEALQAFRRANSVYREGAKVFNSQLVGSVARANPEAVVSAIARAKRPGTIRDMRNAIGDPRAWKSVQGAFLKDLLDSSFEASGDIARGTFLSGKKLAGKLTGFGDDALRELLGEAQLKTFRGAVQALERAQQRTGSGLSGLNIRAGAEVYALGSGNIVLGLTPGAIAQLMTRPSFVRALTQGFNAPPGSRQAIQALNRISGLASAEALAEPRRPGDTETR